jgi:hypothetical protein
MEQLIETIRAAVATGATAEQKTTGAQACRTIFTALEAETGKPIGLPSAPRPHPLSGLTFDQALELIIMRLGPVADARDAKGPAANQKPAAVTAPRIPMIKPPLGARTSRTQVPPNRGIRRDRAR